MTCYTGWTLGYDVNLIPDALLYSDKDLLPDDYMFENYGHMMNAIIAYYIYVNISVIFYFTLIKIRLIFQKYLLLLRLRLCGLGKTKKTPSYKDYLGRMIKKKKVQK